jgi:hypothetical protein
MMSRKPSIKFVFFPVSILLFCAAILFWQFIPAAQAFNQSSGNNFPSNKPDLDGKTIKIPRFDNMQATVNANEPGTTNKTGKPINPTKHLAKPSNKKKMPPPQTGNRRKKVMAEIEIVETEDPHNWSNVSSFLRNTSAVNLESTDNLFPSVLPMAFNSRAVEIQNNSSKMS